MFSHAEGIEVNPSRGAGFQSVYKHRSDGATTGQIDAPHGAPGRAEQHDDLDSTDLNITGQHRLGRSSDKIDRSSSMLRTMHSEDVSEPEEEEKKGLFNMFKSKKEEPESSVNESVEELADAKAKSTQMAAIALITIAVLLLIGSSAYRLLPWSVSAAETVKTLDRKYESADKMKTFWLIDDVSCDLAVGPTTVRSECRLFLNDWRDMVDLCVGPVFYKHCWYYKTDDGIVDQDGNTLYVADGPVTRVVEQVDKISRYATSYYLKKHRYPSKAHLGDDPPDMSFDNPFTGERDEPTFQKIIIGKGEARTEAERSRKKFFDDLSQGHFWPNGPEPHPGQIRCCALSIYSAAGNSKAFVIQILGKDSKPISGSTPGAHYFHALEDGTDVDLSNPKCPEPGIVLEFGPHRRLRMMPVAVWLFLQKPDDGLRTATKIYPLVIFSILSVVFGVFIFTVRAGMGRAVMIMLFLITFIPAITFIVKLFQ